MPVYLTPEEKKRRATERGILVDAQDEWLLEEYTWHITAYGYARTGNNRDAPASLLHHCIVGYPIWKEDEIDHINRNPADNRRSNLRYASLSENRINSSRPPNASGERHIFMRKPYVVRIRRDTQENYVGAYWTMEEAVAARDTWLADN